MQPWITAELRTADLGDERLDNRYRLLLERLSAKPSCKFPAACKGHAEVAAAYRFVNNERIDEHDLLQPHHDATLQRIRQQSIVLLVQDTTETDLTRPNEEVADAGPLNDSSRLGLFVHPLLALTPQRLPLGLVHTKMWARDPEAFDQPADAKAKQRKRKSIQDKESVRWLEGYRQACAVATACPQTQIICLSDSEGDVYECYFAAQPRPEQRSADWIVRACEDRALVALAGEPTPVGHLFAQVATAEVLAHLTVEVSARPAKAHDGRKRKQARQARTATVTVQARRVRLRQPARPGGKRMADVEVNAVLVREPNPPAGEPPLEWLLLTSLPIRTVAEALQVVEYYCCRWQIEIYFRVLKSGCQVEASQLETGAAFRVYLGLCLVVAWRVLYLLMLGRECPELPCDVVLEAAEWQAVYTVVKRSKPPQQPPALGEMVQMIATLGGYLGRKGDGPPGPKTMWLGMQRMTDLVLGWQAHTQMISSPSG